MDATFSGAGRLVLAASTGGHLAQLSRIAPRLGAAGDSLWITFDSPQSRSLLSDRDVLFVPYVSPRDVKGTLIARRLIDERLASCGSSFDGVVSTGAAVALSAFTARRVRKLPHLYIESVSRTHGPSLTGRIVAGAHLASLRTQHQSWQQGRWRYDGSVLDEYETVRDHSSAASSLRVFVTLGTIRPYRFDSLVDAVLRTGVAGADTVWQLGVTERSELPGKVVGQVSAIEFEHYARSADVVVTHAGVGTIMQLLDWGISPVVVPRRKAAGEHVDDHQSLITALLRERGLGVERTVDRIDADALREAASQHTIPRARAALV
jgi:UDP-N-acetylglucosamine transferase subunit ALG13